MKFNEQGAWFDKCKLEPIVFNPPINRGSWVRMAIDKHEKEMAAEVRKMINAGVKNNKDGGNKMDKEELKAWFEGDDKKLYTKEYILSKINQLDEPKQRLSGKYRLLDNIIKHSVVTKHQPDKTVLEIHLDKLDYLFKQLEEPEKPVVQQFVAEWFEDNKHNLDFAIYSKHYDLIRRGKDSEFESWLMQVKNNPIETLIRMKDGYTVESEKKYQVKDKKGSVLLIKNAHGEVLKTPGLLIKFSESRELTEKEIKDYDPRYMAFAVEVD